jgi:hypothetical protein
MLKDGSSPKTVWQQYAIVVGTNISFAINYWTASELAVRLVVRNGDFV